MSGLVAYLPTVGLIVGLCVGFLLWLFSAIFPPALAGVLGALAWVGITGGLHVDGLADCADAFVVEARKEKRLMIMKDPNVGTFASIAIFFILAIKVMALTQFVNIFFIEIDFYSASLAILCLCFTAALARFMVFVASKSPNAREHEKNQGLGKAVTQGISGKCTMLNAMMIMAIAIITWLFSTLFTSQLLGAHNIIIACASVVLLTLALKRKAQKSIGGVTGDVYGCIIEISECVALLSFCFI